MTGDPHTAMAVTYPAGMDPNGARMRPRGPMATVPNPVTAPLPAARNPEPNVERTRSHGDDVNLRRRRFTGFGGDDFARCDRHWTVAINHFTFHTTGEQRDAGADQSILDES